MIDLFKALADETRLRILALVFDGEFCVCEIERSLDLTQSNASRHLNILKNAGFIRGVKRAQWTYYSLDEEFKREKEDLYRYLATALRELPTYERDRAEIEKCDRNTMCCSK